MLSLLYMSSIYVEHAAQVTAVAKEDSTGRNGKMDKPYQNLETPYTTLNPESCALLVIDAQNDWGDPGGARPMPDLDRVMPAIVETAEGFRRAEKPIVFAVRLYEPDGSNVDPCRRWQFERGELRVAVPGTWGSELVASLNPGGAGLDADALLAGEMQELAAREFALGAVAQVLIISRA